MAPPHGNDGPPPPLPPSVEENYKAKCIELRYRMQTVEDANNAAHVRNMRLRRGIEKLRLERAFLLEQLERRVRPSEESEGSPSPPPTPKQKPLRIKRGRRAPETSTLQYENSMAMSQDDNDTVQNSFNDSMVVDEPQDKSKPAKKHPVLDDSTEQPPRYRLFGDPLMQPRNAFEIFAKSARSTLLVRHRKAIRDRTVDINAEIWREWLAMPPEMKAIYEKDVKERRFDGPLDEDRRNYIDRYIESEYNIPPREAATGDDSPEQPGV